LTTRPVTTRGAAIVAPVRAPVGTFGGSLRAVPVDLTGIARPACHGGLSQRTP
jgi:hypothetical protein